MAIQVNGTQVIGNSRELTNIASIDATTKNAIAAAGVGGGLEYLGKTSISSDGAYFQYEWPTSGYAGFKIVINDIRSVLTERRILRLKLVNASNAVNGSGNRLVMNTANANQGTASTDGTDLPWWYASANNVAQQTTLQVTVMYPNSSTMRTFGQLLGGGTENSANVYSAATSSGFIEETFQTNKGIRLQTDYGNLDANSDGFYVWGIKE